MFLTWGWGPWLDVATKDEEELWTLHGLHGRAVFTEIHKGAPKPHSMRSGKSKCVNLVLADEVYILQTTLHPCVGVVDEVADATTGHKRLGGDPAARVETHGTAKTIGHPAPLGGHPAV